ncbi:hypothetical protein BLSTO_06152, partial [Blastocystis sp. subtype 1]
MFRAVELQELPSLETLTFVDAFQNAEELKVENMDNLVSLGVYGNSFYGVPSALTVRNCPRLRELNTDAFELGEKLTIKDTPLLQSASFGSKCFQSANRLVLRDLPALVNVTVGSESFQSADTFAVVNCTALKSLVVGQNSLSSTEDFRLEDVPALETIRISSGCFHSVESFVLEGLQNLVRLTVGLESFTRANDAHFAVRNCSRLEVVEIGNKSFKGFHVDAF